MRRALTSCLLSLTLSLTACAGVGAPSARVGSPTLGAALPNADESARAASRLGPPSLRGIGLRRVDRPAAALPPLALR